MRVNIRFNVAFQDTSFIRDGKKAPWRLYPEVEAEQRGLLTDALNHARLGGTSIKRIPTVIHADGYPKSA